MQEAWKTVEVRKHLFSRRAKGALTHHLQAGGGIPPFGRARALFTNCLSDSSPEGAGNAADRNFLCSRLYILRYQQNDEAAYCHPIPPPARINLPPAALSAVMGLAFCNPHFLFAKKKQKAGNERTVRTNGNLPLGSQSGQPWKWAFCCGSFCLSELLQHS